MRTTTLYVTHDQVEAMTMGDRIAVMNDGVLEQIGTPEDLYERPANTSVGGFIGSPAMAFFGAPAAPRGDGTHLSAEGFEVVVPGVAGLPREVTVGVRSEGARIWRGGDAELLGPIGGEVAFVEALGREAFVGVDDGGVRIVVHDEGRSRLLPGETVQFGLLPRGLRFFDAGGRAVAEPG